MNGNSPLISVVVPIYKVENYLRGCIDSIIRQTYHNIEIILVDDGSPDDCPRICDEYTDIDERIVVIHQSNCGLSGARNTGISRATGEYITFIDSDDLIHPHYVEQLYITLSISNKKISVCSYTYDLDGFTEEISFDYKSYSSSEAIREILLERDFQPSAWGKLYSTVLFRSVNYPVGKIYEDYYTAPHLFHLAGGVSYVNSKLYYYNNNNESIMKSKFSPKKMQYFEVADYVNEFINEQYPSLLPYAHYRDVNMAIAYYKKMSRDGYTNSKDRNEVLKIIKGNSLSFLWSEYPIQKRFAAIIISLFPNTSRWLFSVC